MIAELLIAINLFTTPTHTITPQIHKSQIELNNQYYNISEKALVPNFNPGTGHNVVVQNYIDKGLIATAYNHFAKDGKPTYIAGHNPGALSGVAKDIKMGSIVTGYDNEGNKPYDCTTKQFRYASKLRWLYLISTTTRRKISYTILYR